MEIGGRPLSVFWRENYRKFPMEDLREEVEILESCVWRILEFIVELKANGDLKDWAHHLAWDLVVKFGDTSDLYEKLNIWRKYERMARLYKIPYTPTLRNLRVATRELINRLDVLFDEETESVLFLEELDLVEEEYGIGEVCGEADPDSIWGKKK